PTRRSSDLIIFTSSNKFNIICIFSFKPDKDSIPEVVPCVTPGQPFGVSVPPYPTPPPPHHPPIPSLLHCTTSWAESGTCMPKSSAPLKICSWTVRTLAIYCTPGRV